MLFRGELSRIATSIDGPSQNEDEITKAISNVSVEREANDVHVALAVTGSSIET